VSGAPAEAARPAGPDDVARLAALARRAAGEMQRERGGRLVVLGAPFGEPLEAWFSDHLPGHDHGYQVDVGTIDRSVVGFSAYRRHTLPDGTAMAVVEALYVEPGAREVGVGEVLLRRVVEWGVGQGCSGVDAPALPGMRASKNFFERAGFVARLLVMHRDLGPSRQA
jgi:GNAT superfamily N-acetyltransferase